MAQNLITDIIEAVADSKGIETEELDIVLADYIDLDAVNQLAEHGNSTWELRFELPEHSITLTSGGIILVDGQPEQNWMSP